MPYVPAHRDLEVVRRIVSNGSLTRTAEEMHVTQPAISQRLAALEERLGTRLFDRRGGRMRPTEAAKRLQEAAFSVSRILDQAIEDIEKLTISRQRQLRITTQCHTSYRWLSFVIRDLARQHPQVAVDVVPEAVENPCAAIGRDEVDAALVFLPDPDWQSEARPLFSDELFAVMHPAHALAGRRYLNPANFAGEDLVLYTGPRHAFIDQVLAPAGVLAGRIRQVRMTEAIVELARAGQGIAVLAGWVLNDLVSRRDLAAVRIGRSGYRRTWQAIFGPHCDPEVADSFCHSVVRTASAMAREGWRGRLETG